MTDFKSASLKAAIKSCLRRQKLGYAEVSEHLGCSIPTVKRILGGEELTLGRLVRIVEFLGIDLGELERLAAQSALTEERFTPRQEEFLAKNGRHFAYLTKLYTGLSPKQIEAKYGLSARDSDKYLLALEKNDLLVLSGRQRVRLSYKMLPHLGRGPLAKAYFRSIIQSGTSFFLRLVEDVLFAPVVPNVEKISKGFSLNTAKVTVASYRCFVDERRRANDEFMKLASYEEKTKAADELKTFVLLSAHTLEVTDHPALLELETAFGRVTPL